MRFQAAIPEALCTGCPKPAVTHPTSPTHLNLLNLGMGVEELLEFCWVDVLSSPNNHVLAPPYNFAVAMLIQARDVPAMTTPFWSCPSWVEEWLLLPPSQGGIRGQWLRCHLNTWKRSKSSCYRNWSTQAGGFRGRQCLLLPCTPTIPPSSSGQWQSPCPGTLSTKGSVLKAALKCHRQIRGINRGSFLYFGNPSRALPYVPTHPHPVPSCGTVWEKWGYSQTHPVLYHLSAVITSLVLAGSSQ